MSLQINIMQGFRAIALHHLPIVCRSSGTSILEYIGKYFKFRIEKKDASKLRRLLWKLLGSNQRPPACKAGALNQLS